MIDKEALSAKPSRVVGIQQADPRAHKCRAKMPPSFTCRRFVNSLSAWHDGELTDSARRAFEKHRTKCEQCARYAVAFQRVVAIVKRACASSTTEMELREDLVQAILGAFWKPD
jgi:anti-sigma factor (TIGR02949 family)